MYGSTGPATPIARSFRRTLLCWCWALAGTLALLAAGTDARGQAIARVPNRPASAAVCFAEGTDPDYVERITTLTNLRNGTLGGPADYFLSNRWPGSQGTPYSITWSFVPDGLVISPGTTGTSETSSPSTLFASMDSGFSAQGGRAAWINRFQQMFTRWHQLSGITFTRVALDGVDWDDGAAWGAGAAPGLRGDIRISMHNIDGGSGILAYTYYPASGFAPGDMVIDASDMGNFAGSGNSNLFLRNCVTHELGHAMGLAHVCSSNSGQLMGPFISLSFDGPRQDDIRAIQRHYGDPFELNDTAAAATSLGSLTTGGTLLSPAIPAPLAGSNDSSAALCSIDASGKADWFLVTALTGVTATITATPVGSTYDDNAQAGNGSCPSGSSTNALAIADLVITVFASNGSTQVATSNAAGVGVAEVLSNVPFPAGANYIRISAANGFAQTQLYRLTVTASATPPACPSFTQQPQSQTVCAGDPVTFTAAATNSPTYQWRKNNADITGATNPSYSIAFATGNDAASYTCVASNACGTPAVSNAATLTIGGNPHISQQPASQSVSVGSPVAFTVASSDASGYQWRKNLVEIGGATNATYSIASVAQADAGSYDCEVFSLCGQANSQAATLTVSAGCYANCDQSTVPPVVNAGDFTCFLQQFSAAVLLSGAQQQTHYANCDGSSIFPQVNAGDFTCFLQKYAAGCP